MPPSFQPPTYTLLALYPRLPSSTFTLSSYLSHHIPLAEKLWGPYGMRFVAITPYTEEESKEWHLSCVMTWESKEAYEKCKATGEEAAWGQVVKDVDKAAGEGGFWSEGVARVVFLGGEAVV
jgi:hypothetical protein